MAKTFQDLLNEGQAKVLGIVSIVPMDDWNTDTQYQKLNLVRHNGASYLAKGGSKNVEPGVTQDWQSSWMLVYLDGILSPDGTYPNLTAGRVMHALAWGNKNYDGSSAQTITAADLGLADVYKPQGSIAFASLPATPNESNYGYVWNITNDFTTDSRFIEGAGKKYSAGTNVGVINQDGQYYYDIFGAFVDLSNYATVASLNAEITRAKAAEQANATAAANAQTTANAKYTKPSGGIPKSDLAQSVQDSLDKANSALQSAPVTSVNGKTGAVSLSASDVGAATSAQGAEADQAATDIANIKNGTTVVGAAETANRTDSIVIQNNADLNDCIANINEVQVYTCQTNETAATLANCPVAVTFTLWATRAFYSNDTGTRDIQFLIATNSQCYYRVRSGGTAWASWRTLVESTGTYSDLTAGTAEEANALYGEDIPSSSDLNHFKPSKSEQLRYYKCASMAVAQTLTNCPVTVPFSMIAGAPQVTGGRFVQLILAIGGGMLYSRYCDNNVWSSWREIVNSNGSYPTLGAGYLAKRNRLRTTDVQQGWLKIGTVPMSSVVTWQEYSCIMIINGVFRGSKADDTAPKSGFIEIEARKYSSSIGNARIGVLAGDIPANWLCYVIEDNLDISIYIYNNYYENIDITFEILSEELSNQSPANIFEFSTSTTALASAPSGAVYAVNRNVAAKGITPATDSNSDDVATTEWVNNALPHLYLHRITVTADGTVGAARFMWLSTSSAAYTLTSLCGLIYSSTREGRIIPATGGWSDSTRYYMTTYFQATSATTATVNGIARYISGNNLSHTSGTADVESISDTVTQLF